MLALTARRSLLPSLALLVFAACSSSSSPSAVATSDAGTDGAAPDAAAPRYGASVMEHHNSPARTGQYVEPALTLAAAKGLHLEPAFAATVTGAVYAQPLFLDGGASGKDLVFVSTEANEVSAFDAASGAVVWRRTLGTPVKRSSLPSGCGDIDPLGITGTAYLDPGTRTLYVAAMTTDDGSVTQKHRIFALSVDDGATKSGWPVDVSQAIAGFNSRMQHQRGALALVGGTLYVPYGGHFECGGHHGYVVGVPLANPSAAKAWVTGAPEGGVWAPGGISTDGASLFVTTGQSTQTSGAWAGSKGLLRLSLEPAFSGQTADYWAPKDWLSQNEDVGSAEPLPLELPGATPSSLLVAFTRGTGQLVLLDRANLGGVGGELAKKGVSSSDIITAPVTYATAKGTYVVFNGFGIGCPNGVAGNLTAVRLTPGAPPKMEVAWCGVTSGAGVPIVTTSDGAHDAIVWAVGTEGLDPNGSGTIPGDGRLHGFDGDTGEILAGAPQADAGASDAGVSDAGVSDAGSDEAGAAEAGVSDAGPPEGTMSGARRYIAPIVAKGRLYVATDGHLYAWRP